MTALEAMRKTTYPRPCDPECPVCGDPPEYIEVDCPYFCLNYGRVSQQIHRREEGTS